MQASRILVATDFSPHAAAALERAVWLASQSAGECEVTLIHVVTDLATAVAESSSDLRHELATGNIDHVLHELRHLCRETLEAQLAPYHSTGLRLQHETRLGTPIAEIIRAVLTEGHDVVVTGTRGSRGLKRLLVGSTAKRLIRKCPSSVWVVRAGQDWPLKKVLIATDFSPVSQLAYRQACWLARHAEAELHVVHVMDRTDATRSFWQRAPREVEPPPTRRHAKQQLEQFAATDEAVMRPTRMHLSFSSEPARVISSLARRLGADLVAMGTVGRTGLAGVFLGNTAEKVLGSCQCSVWTVKPDGFVSPIRPGAHAGTPDP